MRGISRRKKIVACVVLALAVMSVAAVLSSCGQPEQKSSSSVKLEASEKTVSSSSSSKAVGTAEKDPFYVLVTGNDTRKGTSEINEPEYADGNARTDTMMLVRVNPRNHYITLVTIPRDTQDWLADGQVCKINEHYNHGGIQETLQAVKGLTGVEPKYYINTTFVGFEDLVNKMGGFNINVPINMDMEDIVTGNDVAFPAGQQDLDGVKALIYARERHAYEDMGLSNMEAYRQSADRKILQTMLTKLLSDPANIKDVTAKLYDTVETNWKLEDLQATAQDFADHSGDVVIQKGTGPYDVYLDKSIDLYLGTRDENTWHRIIEVVNNDGDPSTIVPVLSLAD